jgi:hypothetical protein
MGKRSATSLVVDDGLDMVDLLEAADADVLSRCKLRRCIISINNLV